MVVRAISVLLLYVSFFGIVNAQTARIIPWNDGNLNEFSSSTNAYHPEPIVMGLAVEHLPSRTPATLPSGAIRRRVVRSWWKRG